MNTLSAILCDERRLLSTSIAHGLLMFNKQLLDNQRIFRGSEAF